MSKRDAMERHIQLLIDMNEPTNYQDRIIVWGYSEITKLEAENKRLNAEINIKAEYNMRYFEQLEELRGAAQAAVDNILGPNEAGTLYTMQTDFFKALAAALRATK